MDKILGPYNVRGVYLTRTLINGNDATAITLVWTYYQTDIWCNNHDKDKGEYTKFSSMEDAKASLDKSLISRGYTLIDDPIRWEKMMLLA